MLMRLSLCMVCIGIFSVFLNVSLLQACFILRSYCVPLFEAVASYCRLPFHSYVREVASDGSLLGGVEIDVLVREDVVR